LSDDFYSSVYYELPYVEEGPAYQREIATDFSGRWQIDANPAWETSTFTHETRSKLITRVTALRISTDRGLVFAVREEEGEREGSFDYNSSVIYFFKTVLIL